MPGKLLKFPPFELPAGIKVMTGRNDELPINAWAAIIDPTDPDVNLDVIVSEDLDRRETLTQFSENKKARVVVNGGYFLMDKNPKRTRWSALCKQPYRSAGHKICATKQQTLLHRPGALGFLDGGGIDIAWVTSRNDSLFKFFLNRWKTVPKNQWTFLIFQ
ncbi:MAG: hypothetical protein Ct9H300mP29_8940 [Candidatus Neomarinimicrobiota bacterium]|nr:MAG: hypothetical protein Ct9H300mP29_8940 [Candidatus Neomarinimicrobiota bacterium]